MELKPTSLFMQCKQNTRKKAEKKKIAEIFPSKYKYLYERTLLHYTETALAYVRISPISAPSPGRRPLSFQGFILCFLLSFFFVVQKENLLNLFNTDFNVIGFLANIIRIKNEIFKRTGAGGAGGAEDGVRLAQCGRLKIYKCRGETVPGQYIMLNQVTKQIPFSLFIYIYYLLLNRIHCCVYCWCCCYLRTLRAYYAIHSFIF